MVPSALPQTPPPPTGTLSVTNRYDFAICELNLFDQVSAQWGPNVLSNVMVPQETFTWAEVPAGTVSIRAIDCDGTRVIFRSYRLGDKGHLKARLTDYYGIMTVTNRTQVAICKLDFTPASDDLPVIRPLHIEQLDVGANIIFSTDQVDDYTIKAETCDGQLITDAVSLTGIGELYQALEIKDTVDLRFINEAGVAICAITLNPVIDWGWGLNHLSVPLEVDAVVNIQGLPSVRYRLRVVDCDNNVLWWSEETFAQHSDFTITQPEHYITVNNQTQRSICNVYYNFSEADDAVNLGLMLAQEGIRNFTSRVFYAAPGQVAVTVETCDGVLIDETLTVRSGAEFIVR